MTLNQCDLFETICQEAFVAILVFSPEDNKCVFRNKLATEYTRFDNKEELELKSICPHEGRDRFRPLDSELCSSDGLFQDILIRRKDDTIFIADVGVKHVMNGAEKLTVLMIRDITLQKKLQRDLTAKQVEIQKAFEEILQQNSALKELDKAKDKFIALTSHELRTPLSAMIATAEVLALKLYDTDEQRDDFIKTIHKEGNHLLEIVNDILDFSKIQAGKMDIFLSENSVAPIAESLIEQFEQMATAKEVSIRFENSAASDVAYFDSLRFKQSFSNVLNNAIKFTRPKTEVLVSLIEKNGVLGVVIKDHGPGIPSDRQSSVFNEFETVGNVNTHHKGTGLGMPISKRLMEAMGGRIWFESVDGHGTTFFLELPKTRVMPDELYRIRPEYTDDLAA